MTVSTASISEPTRSTMFLNDITVIDHAYIDNKGCVVGGSFHPCFEVSGNPDSVEKVVVDFSAIKRTIKQLIDRHENNVETNGFDHKVWVIEGYSSFNEVNVNMNMQALMGLDTTIRTPAVVLDLPTDAVKLITPVSGRIPEYTPEYIGAALEQYLQPLLEKAYPNTNIYIKCHNTETIHVPTDELRMHAKTFRYVHGLKDSSSYGCNNIAHGHGSFITADKNPDNILQTIAAELDNTVFVRGDNISSTAITLSSNEPVVSGELTIRYKTSRGFFLMTIDANAHKIVVLNTETTVEYLAQYVKTKFGDAMRAAGITTFYISEGLSKGAIETL